MEKVKERRGVRKENAAATAAMMGWEREISIRVWYGSKRQSMVSIFLIFNQRSIRIYKKKKTDICTSPCKFYKKQE